jgi:hypothetical protein
MKWKECDRKQQDLLSDTSSAFGGPGKNQEKLHEVSQ